MKIPPSILRYWLAMNATAFDSAIDSLFVFAGVAGIHTGAEQIGFQFSSLTLGQLAGVFASAFVIQIVRYLHAHPVSELLPTGPEAGAPNNLKTPGEDTRTTNNPPPTSNANDAR